MRSPQTLGALIVVSVFAAASAMPADAQHRASGHSSRSGSTAAPRQAQGAGQSAAPRQGSGASQAQPRGGEAHAVPRQGPGASQGQPRSGEAHAVPRPGARPGPGPGPGPGYPNRGYRPVYGYRGYYPWYGFRGYSPWWGFGAYYPGFYWGIGAPYWPYAYGSWGYPYYWGYQGYYGFDGGWGEPAGGASLKVEVQPKTAEVYVDGRLAGGVDQFDGMFQSLPLEPGNHDITIYQQGFRSIRQQLYLSPGKTYRIKGTMEPLAPGEPNEPSPQAAQAPSDQQAQPSQILPKEPYWLLDPRSPAPARTAPEPATDPNPPPPGDSRFGQVAIRVQPGDAEVFIDGEAWRTQPGAERLIVQLPAGTHRVEIRREGYDSFVTAVEVRRGETASLNVSLARF